MSKSIIQNNKECYFTGSECYLDKHHIMNGPFRKKAEHYGLWIYIVHNIHLAIHENPKQLLELKQMAQKIFEEKYNHELWMKEFGKNYLS